MISASVALMGMMGCWALFILLIALYVWKEGELP